MVKRCVVSVLASEHVDLECIVVDDHSPDDTGTVLHEAFGSDSHFRYVRQDRNSFQAAARNAGARLARGSFLLFLDDDNIVAPDMCARLVAALRDHPELGLAAPLSVHVLADGRREVWTLGSDFDRRTSQPRDRSPRCREADVPAGEELLPTTYSPNAFCVPRAVFDEVGGFDEAFVQIFEESDFGWRILATGRTAAIVAAARRFLLTSEAEWFRICLVLEPRRLPCQQPLRSTTSTTISTPRSARTRRGPAPA